jgi:hypothetical protein
MYRTTLLAFVTTVVLGLVTASPSLSYGQTLEWDPNPESDIAGYRVYRGTTSGNYTVQVDVGNDTTYEPQGVDWSVPQYFVVTAYNTGDLESEPSDEAVWTPPSVTTFTSVTADSSYPLAVGTPVTWTALATNNLGPVEYRFYLYRQTGWTMVRDYDTSNAWTWTPAMADVGSPNYLQVWARAVGSTALFEAYRGTQAFEIVPPLLQIAANLEFPTPADNVVTWTALSSASVTTPQEYQFRVMNQSTGNWTVFRGYAANNQAQWIPGASGTYVVEAWARPVGSGVQYASTATSVPFSVQPTAISVPWLFVDATFPSETGKPITWTAWPKGGMAGPLQYQFWLYSQGTGWKNAQPYGPSQSFTWTPTFGDAGSHSLQVWVRRNGSTAAYEAWRASPGSFPVTAASLHLTTATRFPAPPGHSIQWTADVPDPTANVEYEFSVYSTSTGQWSIAQPYGLSETFTWVPGTSGDYAIRARVREVGSSAAFEAETDTDLLKIAVGGGQLFSLVSDRALPVVAGTAITWTATASGGSGPLQYQFWRDDGTGWFLVQDYSAVRTYTWVTSGLDAGSHNLQVRVRSTGSSDAYESYMISGAFSILP